MLRLAGIRVYPVKSCRGITVQRATVGHRGLAGDRRFMLVDRNGRFLTQRQHPTMALLSVTFSDGEMLVSYPGHATLSLDPTPHFATQGRVKIWRGTVDACIAPQEVNDWFSGVMALECRLAYMADHQHRAVPHASARFDDEVSFADGAPLMAISEASLEQLNQRLERPVTMDRFRPNLIVAGCNAFAEDTWSRVRIGDVETDVAWPCARCLMTTVEPKSGRRDVDREPFETLRQFRRAADGRVMFGQNLIPRRLGELRVGDVVEVLQ